MSALDLFAGKPQRHARSVALPFSMADRSAPKVARGQRSAVPWPEATGAPKQRAGNDIVVRAREPKANSLQDETAFLGESPSMALAAVQRPVFLFDIDADILPQEDSFDTVRARPGRLSALSVSHRKSVFVWRFCMGAHGA